MRMILFGVINIILAVLLFWGSLGAYNLGIYFFIAGLLPVLFIFPNALFIIAGVLLLRKNKIGIWLSLFGSFGISLFIPFQNFLYQSMDWGWPYKAFHGLRIGYFLPFFCLMDCDRGIWNIDHGVIFYPVYSLLLLLVFWDELKPKH